MPIASAGSPCIHTDGGRRQRNHFAGSGMIMKTLSKLAAAAAAALMFVQAAHAAQPVRSAQQSAGLSRSQLHSTMYRVAESPRVTQRPAAATPATHTVRCGVRTAPAATHGGAYSARPQRYPSQVAYAAPHAGGTGQPCQCVQRNGVCNCENCQCGQCRSRVNHGPGCTCASCRGPGQCVCGATSGQCRCRPHRQQYARVVVASNAW